MMRALVLNLATSRDRMAFQHRQLDRLNIGFDRMEATTPQMLDPPAGDAYWLRWERPMRDVEKAVLLSHRAAWRHVAAQPAPMLVLEDDAWLSDRVPEMLACLEPLAGLDHVSLETRGRKKVVGRRPHPVCPGIRRLYQDRTGAAAYVLWPSGARKLLDRSNRRPGLSDAVICSAYEMASWQAVPALAIQLDQCATYGLKPPLDTVSSILPTQKPPHDARALSFRLRRVLAQLRMGLRMLGTLPVAERIEVRPDGLAHHRPETPAGPCRIS